MWTVMRWERIYLLLLSAIAHRQRSKATKNHRRPCTIATPAKIMSKRVPPILLRFTYGDGKRFLKRTAAKTADQQPNKTVNPIAVVKS